MQNQPGTFQAAEASDFNSPTFAYVFIHTPIVGAAQFFYLTSYDRPIVIGNFPAALGSTPKTFESFTLTHSAPEQQAENNEPRLDVTLALQTSAQATEFRKYFLGPIPKKVEVLVLRINSSALNTEPPTIVYGTDTYPIFRGRMTSVAFAGPQMQIAFVNLMLQDDGRIPRYYYQKMCQHQFGGIFCGKDLTHASITKATTIAALSRANRTLDIADTDFGGVALTQTSFPGGLVYELNGSDVINTIGIGSNIVLPAAAGVRLRLSWWSNTLQVGNPIKVVRGCLKTTGACTEFENIGNFGGMPYIPISNPAIDSISV